jgi:hypothetical protein
MNNQSWLKIKDDKYLRMEGLICSNLFLGDILNLSTLVAAQRSQQAAGQRQRQDKEPQVVQAGGSKFYKTWSYVKYMRLSSLCGTYTCTNLKTHHLCDMCFKIRAGHITQRTESHIFYIRLRSYKIYFPDQLTGGSWRPRRSHRVSGRTLRA